MFVYLEQSDMRLVPDCKGTEKQFFISGADLYGVGYNQGRLLFGHCRYILNNVIFNNVLIYY